jgi:ATP-dependent protease HslVU (ClpYQ) peptidase subunit
VTTIVSDGVSMGCEGQISSGETICETDCMKIFRLNDGALVGMAGNTYNWEVVLDYLNSNSKTKKWPELQGHQDTLVLEKDGTIWLYDHLGRRFQRTAPVAIGSGWKYALAAMDCGADVEEAIRIAIGRDSYSSGTIRVVDLEEDED